MTIEQLKQFFDERPSLSKRGVSLELGHGQDYVLKIIKSGNLCTRQINDILPVMVRYGYVG